MDCALSRYSSMAGCRVAARSNALKLPKACGRIASYSCGHTSASMVPLVAATQKWLDQNCTQRSATGVGVSMVCCQRRASPLRLVCRRSLREGVIAPNSSLGTEAPSGGLALSAALSTSRVSSKACTLSINPLVSKAPGC